MACKPKQISIFQTKNISEISSQIEPFREMTKIRKIYEKLGAPERLVPYCSYIPTSWIKIYVSYTHFLVEGLTELIHGELTLTARMSLDCLYDDIRFLRSWLATIPVSCDITSENETAEIILHLRRTRHMLHTGENPIWHYPTMLDVSLQLTKNATLIFDSV